MLPPGLGNQATGRLLQALRTPSGPMLQGRWLVNDRLTHFFWENDGEDKEEAYEDLPPWLLSGFEDDPPHAYQVDDGKTRTTRNGPPSWYTLERRPICTSKSGAANGHDTFNPFGRFDLGGQLVHPEPVALAAALLETLAATRGQLQPVTSARRSCMRPATRWP